MSHISFQATAAEQFAEARQRSDSGLVTRLGLATAGGIVGAFVIDWHGVAIALVALFLWELIISPAVKRTVDKIARERGPEAGILCLAPALCLGSLAYSAIPAQMIAAGSPSALYIGMAWLIGALLHVAVYYSNLPTLLATQIWIPGSMLIGHPFAVLPLGHALPSAAVLSLLMFAIVQFAMDRKDLLRAMARREHEKRAAEAANVAKSQFLASMSHELRTPLNAILGYAELIEEEHGNGNASLRADVRKVRNAGGHLLGLINEVLDFAKLEANELKVDPDWFDVAAWARETVSMVQPLAEKNGNALTLELGPALPPAFTDAARLRQCVINLAGNACKFTENGRVVVCVSVGEGLLTVTVTDTGIGMSEDQLARLFTPFTQGDETISRRFGGTGLGLSITRNLAHLLGGRIDVSSQPGEGSVFTLVVPLMLEGKPAASEAA